MGEIRTAESRLRRIIDAVAAFKGLPGLSYKAEEFTPGELLEGIVLGESGGNPRARRYEPHQDRANRRDRPQDPDTADRDDGDLEDDSSYGLLQVMGFNARMLHGVAPGTPMRFGFLFRPLTNLDDGTEIFLAELKAVYREHPHAGESERVVRALARYNGGPTGDWIVDGDIRLRQYVDHIARHAALAKADRSKKGWQ